ncbi:dihydroxy-acid dehydratase, partial [Roseomonas sp. GCM10028921]
MSSRRKMPEDLRSARWFAPDNLCSFLHRSRVLQIGLSHSDYEGRPVIAIVNTWSEMNPCHAYFRDRAEDVKRGVLQAGGLPIELPAISLFESLVKPTAMLYRNFLSMETEELLRSQPIDGAVLMGGCDKTTPGLLMGAISIDIPAVFVPAGPMLRGNWHGRTLGSGSDAFKYWDERRAGRISRKDWQDIKEGIARSPGTCMTMGTASTRGNLAPDVCVIKPSACDPRLHVHSGPALVFEDYPDLKARIDRDDLDVTPETVLVLRNGGPLGGPGMPEIAMIPLPLEMVRRGVRDMVRISDARMSGTSYVACILHVSPESFVGGPLALLCTGNMRAATSTFSRPAMAAPWLSRTFSDGGGRLWPARHRLHPGRGGAVRDDGSPFHGRPGARRG